MRRAAPWCAALVALAVAVGVAAVVSIPAGAAGADGTLPEGARLAARQPVGDLEILLAAHEGRLLPVVAFQGARGWHGLDLDPVAADTVAAVSVTAGAGAVPPVSAVYGRARGALVTVRWDDGREDDAAPAVDGAYVVARSGRHGVALVVVRDADGGRVTEVRP